MYAIIKEFSEKGLGYIALVRIKFAGHLVSQRVNDIFIAVIDIGPRQYKVNNLTFFIAQQMQFKAHIPSHCALAFLCNSLEDLHGELPLVVYYRYTGAVHEADSGALSETGQFQKHREGDETAGHNLHNCMRKSSGRDASSAGRRIPGSNA